MLSYIEVMRSWVEEQDLAGAAQAVLSFRGSPADRDKRSADVILETETTVGSVAVWESGEVEAEVLHVGSEHRILVISTVLERSEALREVLERTLATVESGTAANPSVSR